MAQPNINPIIPAWLLSSLHHTKTGGARSQHFFNPTTQSNPQQGGAFRAMAQVPTARRRCSVHGANPSTAAQTRSVACATPSRAHCDHDANLTRRLILHSAQLSEVVTLTWAVGEAFKQDARDTPLRKWVYWPLRNCDFEVCDQGGCWRQGPVRTSSACLYAGVKAPCDR